MASGDASSMSGHFALRLAVVWAVLFGLYMLFAGSLSLDEAVTGAACAGVGSVWWARAGRTGGIHFSGWTRCLGPVGKALAAMPGATVRVGGQLVGAVLRGGPPGSVAYRRDADSAWADAETPAERALGLIGASLAPDTYVLREHGGDGGIVDHALSPEGVRP
jgi:hypothetical protein